MVSKYLKALALTAIILVIGLAAINYMDNLRSQSLSDEVDARALDLQASAQLLLYESVFSGDDVCRYILGRVESEKAETGKVLRELETAEKTRLFSDSGILKKKYLLQNVELYLLVTKAINDCGSYAIKPVVYFYPDKYYCAECASQAAVLDSVVQACPEVRVFAFPSDLGIPVIEVLMKKYGIERFPTLLYNGEKHDSLVSEGSLKQGLGCKTP